MIQTRFWMPNLRRLVRKRNFMCLKCFKLNAKSRIPVMGDLPSYRVQAKRAFAHTGVDFAGPFAMRYSLKRKADVSKVYLCLFVCMETKALHLEAVTQLSTESFLATFDRFCSRRGLPQEMFSDCGSNFIGASNHLKDLHRWFQNQDTQRGINDYFLKFGVKWNFNPALAPHFGGIWESGVRSVKRHMKTCAGNTPLTFEELSTLFAKFEAILNSRPICPLSSDPDASDYLSPGHFLVGGPLVALPERSILDRRENLLTRWQLVKRMYQQFWSRWRREYLQTLQRRPKWKNSTPNLQVGNLVLLKDSSSPMDWPMGKVVATHPGTDGVVRVVTVQTSTSSFRRAVAKLVPLLPLSIPSH
ncbi:hypothetical protein GE061_011462 [Apolygus lucorum]|uniref:Integrase catalytic domain-containing protein n=1 Tax=Apolygus lucorum TaxID=248454 RepID=A0A8S9XXG6_APOLU|nr:hypothetical protein GE061_011462 [Apolygus lucorum]